MTLEKAYRGNHQANASGDKANKPHKVLIMALAHLVEMFVDLLEALVDLFQTPVDLLKAWRISSRWCLSSSSTRTMRSRSSIS
ncbi:hypothetical protein Thiowin_01072 [Thiorhodovibrio winogradskyi]|uniref:Uncharacterized protein n=1 Tax=Thiorhodovibrio winogradskyi TaxID=77007 RepID=A0ABZ0S6J2_9GAMM